MTDLFTDTSQYVYPSSDGKPVVIEALGLNKTFTEGGGGKLEILKNINLRIHAGEKIAIVGASGSGKSTLLHLLGGLDLPTSGQVLVSNKNMAGMKEKHRCFVRNQNLGFIYQFHHLLPEFSAEENVAMPALIGNMSPLLAINKARILLEKVGMLARIYHKPSELSGGERQRAAIARAMINEPRCICADEPTGNLDTSTADQVLQVLLRLNEEYATSLIVVTHDMVLARKMDVVYKLENGQLTQI